MTARGEIAKLTQQIRAVYQRRCAGRGCGHAYDAHVSGLRCYAVRCKCKAFIDRESTGEGEMGCAR